MLKKSALGWPKIAGLGIALVVAGQFSGWNFGLMAGGWMNMLIATVLMALLCGGLALCVAELSTALPSAGGVFVYAQSAFGPFVGYLVGVACAIALTIGTGAAATFICAYTESIFGLGGWPVKIALFAVIIGIHLRGVGEAMGLTMIAGVIAVGALLTFGVAMAPHVETANLLKMPAALTGPAVSLGGIFACVPFAIWLFITVEQTGSAAEEAHNPGRTMPRGILAAIGTLLVTALVVLVCAPGAGGVELVGSAGDPLYAAMTSTNVYGDASWLANVVGCGAVFGLIATFFSLIYAASRQLFAMARDGLFPQWLGKTGKRGTPFPALLLIGVIGLPMSAVDPATVMLAVVLLLNVCYLFIFGAYLRIKSTQPDLPRPFRLAGGTVVAWLGLALTLMVIAACFQLDMMMLIALVVTFVLCIFNFLLRARMPARSADIEVPDHA
ncbi:ethanolamine permease [Pseudomonas sp. 3296]|uniref:amino acid permease n=1 Tax=Pseudomonas sp. 3296 TaxID=2817753 RepID=UPI00285CF2FD|nr:amino acid permease [Pseudomonas sp. 3296]MDR6918217.1 ethanolamine permease [Pseudomonas sp. 3296]